MACVRELTDACGKHAEVAATCRFNPSTDRHHKRSVHV